MEPMTGDELERNDRMVEMTFKVLDMVDELRAEKRFRPLTDQEAFEHIMTNSFGNTGDIEPVVRSWVWTVVKLWRAQRKADERHVGVQIALDVYLENSWGDAYERGSDVAGQYQSGVLDGMTTALAVLKTTTKEQERMEAINRFRLGRDKP